MSFKRVKNGEVLYGVCTGISKESNINVNIIRILFLLFIKISIIIYFILSLSDYEK